MSAVPTRCRPMEDTLFSAHSSRPAARGASRFLPRSSSIVSCRTCHVGFSWQMVSSPLGSRMRHKSGAEDEVGSS